MTKPTLKVLEQDSGLVFGRVDNLGVILWLETPTSARVSKIVSRFPSLDSGNGFALLTVVTPACAPVGAEVRNEFDRALKANRRSVLGIGTVIQVQGVLGGLTRAIVRTLAVISRLPYPSNIYGAVADAAKWLPQILSTRGDPTLTAEEIIEIVETELAKHR